MSREGNKERKQIKAGKKVFAVAGGILALFVLLNIVWFIWRGVKYGSFTDGMEKSVWDTVLVPRYILSDSEGYDYAVKYPDYLTFTGNLSVGMPASDNSPFTDSLIIWPLLDGSYEYGVLLYEGEDAYQIYIDMEEKPLESEYHDVIERHSDNIYILLQKADELWDVIP